MRRPLIAAALLLAPLAFALPAAAQQVYKWTDASGSVHYSDTPPPKGGASKKITLSGIPQSSPSEAPQPAKEGSGREQTSGSAEAPAQAPVADTPDNRKKLCTTLKGNLDILRDKKPVVVQEGNQAKVLDDAQRKQQQSTAEAQYKQYCPNE
ncbi:DUF4124 domain-containing protein [Dyella sp. LX-66]|uniref:DUF4124 domain-containing protein n=1 Tax=unclassified Dyella TaxID=2634549 RepID=UPI001BE0F3DE|nr:MULTISPECIES: DUF4124 domain-containing protein [unclassified Dyella]MBT2115459.1 DUF4124 domain-containing protein [Dyella sp. LX-1]MBT2139274.1 DUF4124 domain-containing protein [Dyella sp. LX-66]